MKRKKIHLNYDTSSTVMIKILKQMFPFVEMLTRMVIGFEKSHVKVTFGERSAKDSSTLACVVVMDCCHPIYPFVGTGRDSFINESLCFFHYAPYKPTKVENFLLLQIHFTLSKMSSLNFKKIAICHSTCTAVDN